MPRRQTPNRLTRLQRLERSYVMFGKGYRNVDIKRALGVSDDTVRRYRRQYEAHIQLQASENPALLTDVLGNTVRLIEEIDLVRQDAWNRLDREHKTAHSCSECGCRLQMPVNEAVALDRLILDTAKERMRLFGLLGIKQEYFIHVQRMALIQGKVLEFLGTELCSADRAKFETYLCRELSIGSEETHGSMAAPDDESTDPPLV